MVGFSLSLVGLHLYKQAKEDPEGFRERLEGCWAAVGRVYRLEVSEFTGGEVLRRGMIKEGVINMSDVKYETVPLDEEGLELE